MRKIEIKRQIDFLNKRATFLVEQLPINTGREKEEIKLNLNIVEEQIDDLENILYS